MGDTIVPTIDDEALTRAYLTFVADNADLSHAQLCQDLFVFWALRGETAGYFVEAGAFDGLTLSNSYLLEHLGWKGLLIEPMPAAFAELGRHRRCSARRAALSTRDGETLAFRTCLDGAELSRLEHVDPRDAHEEKGRRQRFETIEVRSVRIGTALADAGAPAVVDYLSLDTEGNELDILRDFPFEQFHVRCLTVEHNHTDRTPVIDAFLAGRGYRRVCPALSLFDGWFLHETEIEALARRPVTSPADTVDSSVYVTPTSLTGWTAVYRGRLGKEMIQRGMEDEAERYACSLLGAGLDEAALPVQLAVAEARGAGPEVTGPLYDVLARLDPDNGVAALRGAAWRSSIGEDEAAVMLLRQCRNSWGMLAMRHAQALVRLGRIDEALNVLGDLATREPGNAEARIEQARLLRQAGRVRAGEALLRAHAASFAGNAEYNRVFRHFLLEMRRTTPPRPIQPEAGDFDGRIAAAVAGARSIDPGPLHALAGQIVTDTDGDWQVMHNGIAVPKDAYFGAWMTELIRRCGGRHEPQEERVFDAVLPCLAPGSRMIELGAFWSFYTASFLASQRGEGHAIAVEPDPENLLAGVRTLQRNGLSAEVLFGRIGPAGLPDTTSRYGARICAPRLDVKALMAARGWTHLDVLHADIQGAEKALMDEIGDLLAEMRIGYVFVSTHGRAEQIKCLEALDRANYVLIAEHDMAESYSFDGLVAARAPDRPGPSFIDLPLRGRPGSVAGPPANDA